MIFQNFGFNAISKPSPLPPLSIEWLLVGGGASGGTLANRSGGGGGAGRFVSSSISIEPQSISIVIGAGGAARSSAGVQGADGGDSEMTIGATTYISYGGGGGGAGLNPPNSTRNGRPGGSGGGGAGTGTGGTTTGGQVIEGEPIAGFGNPGEDKATSQDPVSGYGGGAGTGRSGRAWLDGVTYCVGGPGASTGAPTGQTAGCGSDGSTNSNSAAGKNGICIIRYAGSQKATGGTVSSSGGYTYHTFTSDGTFTY